MTSSKKIRGRARRKAKENERESSDFPILLRRIHLRQVKGGCTHGWSSINVTDLSSTRKQLSYSDNQKHCYKILETAVEAICISEKNNERVGGAFEAARTATDENFPFLYKDASLLEQISQAFLCIGVELILDPAGKSTLSKLGTKAKNLFRCATALALSEYLCQYVEVKIHCSKPFFYYHKVHDLICSDERRMVSYLKKRIPCTSCLDAKYKEVKAHKKMSICNNLNCTHEKVELNALLTCERCKRAHYCSQSCQAVDWEAHKHDCIGWKKWKKLQKKTTAEGVSKPRTGSKPPQDEIEAGTENSTG